MDTHDHSAGQRSSAAPRTLPVLGLLAATALIFSYLASYALSDALLNAEVIAPWSADEDPRPRWLLGSFVVLVLFFALLGALFRWLSRRQLQVIDAMDSDLDKI